MAREELEKEQQQLEFNPIDCELQGWVMEMRQRAFNLSEAERSFYLQKEKCHYLANSDRNTKFFHTVVKRNRKKNTIASVIKEDGTPTEGHEEVVGEFLHYYQAL